MDPTGFILSRDENPPTVRVREWSWADVRFTRRGFFDGEEGVTHVFHRKKNPRRVRIIHEWRVCKRKQKILCESQPQ